MKTALNRNLQIGFGISLLLLIISSVLSFLAIRNLLESSGLVDHSAEVYNTLENIVSTMKDAETGQRGYLLTDRSEFLEPYNGSFEKAVSLTNHAADITRDNPVQQANIAVIRDILVNRLKIQRLLIEKKQAGKVVTVDDLREGKASMDALREAIKKAEREEKNLLETRTTTLKKFSSYTPLIIVLAAILAIAVSLFSFIKVTAEMRQRAKLQGELEAKDEETTRRIATTQHIAEQISLGDYQVRVDEEQKDDLGGLAIALNKMAESLEIAFNRLSDNEWMQTGISNLNDQMIGEKDVTVLSNDILKFITGYTRSQVGALYLLQNNKLNLTGSFALTGAPVHIALGEGLAGQAAQNDEEVWLKEIEETDIIASHATGALKVKNVIVIPIHHEKKVKGIIELASIYAYPQRKIDFLRNITGNVGIAIHSAESRRQMQALLEETQAQSEELQAQHSELENLNSELETHTQKLQTSEEELRVQQEELQQTNKELEERNKIINTRNSEIQQKAEELEQSTRYKSEFMANMSHELRTPLNSILLLSRYLAENSENNLSAEQIESASVILNSGNGLLTLIDELLDLSKIEAGKMELEYQQVPVDELVNSLQSLFAPVAKEKKLELVVANELTDITAIESDRMRLEQILKNLLSNALKFTAEGQVKLRLANDAKTGYVRFSVIDTGIGIAADKQALVFNAFQQADGSTKRKFGGTGLGLSISREFARLLGGEITLTSEPGKGSEFSVSLPVNRPDQEAPSGYPKVDALEDQEQISIVPARSKFLVSDIPEEVEDDRQQITADDKTVLIIEDDTAFAKGLLNFTRKNGYKGIVAVRGDHGISLAKQYKPVAILLDLQLPVKDGWEVMDELKGNPATRHIPVHIMSSLEAKRESRLKGAVDFINKPIAIEQMTQMFRKLEDALSRHPKKVLIVEENTKHAQALAYFLETFNVSAAVSGSVNESVDALQNKEVDCVIMDMGLPGENAYETLESIKQNPGLEDLPVIVFTGKSLSLAEENKIRQYADTIVVKTAHSYQRILDEVALFLHLVEEHQTSTEKTPSKNLSVLNEILKGKTVLIADDDARNIFSITKYLEKQGMQVISATDGKEALEQLDQHPETNVVLMDMMMPNMDGYESTTKIRQHPKFKHLPVIAVTAKAMLGDRDKCIQAGASDYISKPVDADQLVSLLRVWLFNQHA